MAMKPSAKNSQKAQAGAEQLPDEALEEMNFEEVETDKSAELAAEKDRVLRLQADMENLRARTSRELAEQQRYAAMPLVRDLLPVVDNIERAIEAAEKSGDAKSLLEGFKLVHQQLLTLLEQHQCKPMKALGELFDPQFHAAILQQPNAEIPSDHVAQVAQEGFLLHDRVIRPAQVIISTGPAEVPPE